MNADANIAAERDEIGSLKSQGLQLCRADLWPGAMGEKGPLVA